MFWPSTLYGFDRLYPLGYCSFEKDKDADFTVKYFQRETFSHFIMLLPPIDKGPFNIFIRFMTDFTRENTANEFRWP
jgi:hypothetical protein